MPDSVYAWFDIESNTCHQAPYYLNSEKPFLTLSDQYRNQKQGFEPRTLGILSAWIWDSFLDHSATTANFMQQLLPKGTDLKINMKVVWGVNNNQLDV